MDILFFCTRWGSEHLPWPEFLTQAKDAGFDGVEAALPADTHELQDMLQALEKSGLKLIGVHWDTVTSDYDQHKAEQNTRLQELIGISPLFITSHTGKDYFTMEQNLALLKDAELLSKQSGIDILHETHRGKFSFAAHIMKPYLDAMPALKLTLDISHWFTVAESYLQDQQQAVEQILLHAAHIHARIGYTQGPQVDDPRKLQWKEALENHLKCWDKVVLRHQNRGAARITFTSEFGPFPYMSTFGKATTLAVKHQWEINNFMKDLLKNRYNGIRNQD